MSYVVYYDLNRESFTTYYHKQKGNSFFQSQTELYLNVELTSLLSLFFFPVSLHFRRTFPDISFLCRIRSFLPKSVRLRTSRSPKLKSLSRKAIIDIADPLVPEAFTGFEPFPGVLRPSPFRCPESFRMSRNKQKEI